MTCMFVFDLERAIAPYAQNSWALGNYKCVIGTIAFFGLTSALFARLLFRHLPSIAKYPRESQCTRIKLPLHQRSASLGQMPPDGAISSSGHGSDVSVGGRGVASSAG